MKRRTLVKLLLGAAAAGVGGLMALRPSGRRKLPLPAPEDSAAPNPARALKEALPMLKVGDEVVAAFLADMARHDMRVKLGKNGKPSSEDVQKFLLSTDFFNSGDDESRPLKYVRLYDPYLAPCYNPLHMKARG